MRDRIFFALLLLGLSTRLLAGEVVSMISCLQKDEGWRCAEWSDGLINVFESETYQSKVEFTSMAAAPESLSKEYVQVKVQDQPVVPQREVSQQKAPQLVAPQYTLQLLACQSVVCLKQMEKIGSIPDSRIVDLKSQGKPWRVLLVGEYRTREEALKARGELRDQYRLKEMPWIRSLY